MELSLIAVFVCMIFCHIIDDYYLQGWLASAKQKIWWEKNAPDPKEYEIQEITGSGVKTTIKQVPEDVLGIIKKMLAVHAKENRTEQ